MIDDGTLAGWISDGVFEQASNFAVPDRSKREWRGNKKRLAYFLLHNGIKYGIKQLRFGLAKAVRHSRGKTLHL